MTVSYVDSDRRGDLRSAALFVIDKERQQCGFDKRVAGSASVADVVRVFDEILATFPLSTELGDGIRAEAELPLWEAVLEAMDPIWKVWPQFALKPEALLTTRAWRHLEEAVRTCVERAGLWFEEIHFPVTVAGVSCAKAATSWEEIQRCGCVRLDGARLIDADGRAVEVLVNPSVTLRRVGLPVPR